MKDVLSILFIIWCVLWLRGHIAHAQELHFASALPKLPPIELPLKYDPHKLAIAISCAETSCGKDGTAVHRNNCCGLMVWDKFGNRQPRYFARYEDSLNAAAQLWQSKYGRFPDIDLAIKWTGEPGHARQWLATVQQTYATL